MHIQSNPDFRIVFRLFGVFLLLLTLSLTFHVFINDRLVPAIIIESHLGSEVTMSMFKDWPDNFREPGQTMDFLKIASIHLCAFTLYGFIIFHLLFSLHGKTKFIKILAINYLVSSIGVIIAPFVFFLTPIFALYFYYITLFVFLVSTFATSIALFYSADSTTKQ